MSWLLRSFFIFIAVVSAIGIFGGTACTRKSGGIAPPTAAPQATIYVDAKSGSDSNSGKAAGKGNAFKTLTHALAELKKTPTVTFIEMHAGDYNAKNGEVFPIVVPTGVTLNGENYSKGPNQGSYIDGTGEDTVLEGLTGARARSIYTTLAIPQTVTGASANDVYVGTSSLGIPGAAMYYALDVLGQFTPSQSTFGLFGVHTRFNGVIVPSGSFNCTACVVNGHTAVEAISIAKASSPPSVVLGGQFGQGVVGGLGTGILTDGTASIQISNQTFRSREHVYDDHLTPLASSSPTSSSSSSSSSSGSGTIVDFGYGAGSTGGNLLNSISKTDKSEIYVTKSGASVYALNNIWIQNVQHSNSSGLYTRNRTFRTGTVASPGPSNVEILGTATGSVVYVGPVPTPTPSPSSQPSSEPSGSPSPSPTPT